MPEPSPAKTKISIEKNSAKAALIASGWLASPGAPIAILEMAIFSFLQPQHPPRTQGLCILI